MLRGGAGCGLRAGFFICCGAVRAAGQTSALRAGLRARICQNMRGGAGCGPNDTVAGRVRVQLFQPRSLNSLIICTLSLPISCWIT